MHIIQMTDIQAYSKDAPVIARMNSHTFLLAERDIKEVMFHCSCGWQGSEMELDVMTKINMVCCPICHNDDVRVLNEIEEIRS